MRLVSQKILNEFAYRHPEARAAIKRWASVVEAAFFADFHDVLSYFRYADYVAPYTVFNLAGNKYRVIAIVDYAAATIFVRWTYTHAEYDKWSKRYRQGRSKP